MSIFSRNELYWGEDAQIELAKMHDAVIGLGGVGGYCAEMLARAGIGELTVVDFDKVAESNINRQVIALNSTIGQAKTMLFQKRLEDINPDIKLNIITDFYTEKLNDKLLALKIDFIADAIDTLRSKISLLEFAYENRIPTVSSFGAGNRINPGDLCYKDISELKKDKRNPFVTHIFHQLKTVNYQ